MKILIIIALALIAGASLMWLAEYESGFVLLQYGSWSLETSLIIFVVAFLILVVAAYLTLRSLVFVKQTPQKLADWRLSRRQHRAGQALTRGLITLEEGRWAEAERLLIRHASNSETPLLHYLAAARAAQKQNASDRRDTYLRLAHETTEGADVAVGVVQAELQIAAEQKEQAIATLQHLREMSPKHPYVLQLLQQTYSDMNQWQDVQDVLPDLRKRHVMASSDVQALSSDAAVGQLQAALAKQDWQLMSTAWQQASNKMRQTESLLNPYVSGLIQQGEMDQAVELIERFLNKNWSDSLVYQYGHILQGDNVLKRLAKAEGWLKNNVDNPWLLLTLGRLSQATKLWAKSEDYLRRSIEYGARGETYHVLAEVLLAEDKSESAAELYKQGLELMLAQTKAPV
ncbi:MAG: heme biosynthesis protein HemY [Methylophaga sp.]|nr:MAG: heme biosynthesis protein HemY [Methylophaga sp.]